MIVTVPGEESCPGGDGLRSVYRRRDRQKVAANNIEMMAVEGSDIQIPVDTCLAMVATLQQSVEVGDHILHICQVDKFLAMRTRRGCMPGTASGKLRLR